MGFKIKLCDSKIFKNAFEALSVIVDEIQIIVDEEGLRCSALDRSHITFCNLELKSDLFDEFECDSPEKINIDTMELMNVLKRIKANDILDLSLEESSLVCLFTGDAVRRFRIKLIDIEYNKPEPPEIPVSCEIMIPSNLIKDGINDVALYSDKLEFVVEKDYFIIKSNDDFGDVEVKYLHGTDVNEDAKSCFGIDKIKSILKSSKFSSQVKVGLGNDMPLLLDFTLPTGDGSLGFMLAPRLVEED